jgi:hypothetical protein
MTLFRSSFSVERSAVGGAHFFGIVHKVAAYRESDALCFGFVGTFRGDEASIRCLTSRSVLEIVAICVAKLATCEVTVTCGTWRYAWLTCVAGKCWRMRRRCDRRDTERLLHHVRLLMPG